MGFGTHTEKKLDCNPRQQGQSMTDDENTNNRHKKQRMMVGKHRKSQWVALTVKCHIYIVRILGNTVELIQALESSNTMHQPIFLYY